MYNEEEQEAYWLENSRQRREILDIAEEAWNRIDQTTGASDVVAESKFGPPQTRSILARGREYLPDARMRGLNPAQKRNATLYKDRGLSFDSGSGELPYAIMAHDDKRHVYSGNASPSAVTGDLVSFADVCPRWGLPPTLPGVSIWIATSVSLWVLIWSGISFSFPPITPSLSIPLACVDVRQIYPLPHFFMWPIS